jgi:Spy/CpxP family protein refolding chaperone
MTMKKQPFAVICLLIGGLSIGGLSACTPSQSSESQVNADQTTAANSNSSSSSEGGTNRPSAAERAQKRQAVLKKIEGVLTPAQNQELQTKLQQGERMRAALRELNLQESQKTQITDILKAAYPHRKRQS